MPNKALQATAAALCASAVAMSHSAVVAGASALPAAVPGMCSQSYSADGEEGPTTPTAVGGE